MDDSSLDEFLDDTAEDDGSADEATKEAEDDGSADEATKEADDIEPATSTSHWSDESTCDTCGEAAERLWNEDGSVVCTACKSW